jgi:chromosome segregation ATPase
MTLRVAKLESDHDAAVKELRRLEDEKAEYGKRFATASQHFQALWAKRTLVDNAKRDLDEARPEFPLAHEQESYKRKRSALAEEYQSLSAQIGEAGTAALQHTIDNLTFEIGRTKVAIHDIEIAIDEAKSGTRQHM